MRGWDEVEASLRLWPPGVELVLSRQSMPHPSTAGAVTAIGLPRGQLADWRFPPAADCQGLHVHEYAERWVAHLDRVHPDCGRIEHLRVDAPRVLVGVAMSLGAIFGALADREHRRRGLVLGMTAGTCLGAVAVAAKKK